MRWTAFVAVFLWVPVSNAEELPSIFGDELVPLQMWAFKDGPVIDPDRTEPMAAR